MTVPPNPDFVINMGEKQVQLFDLESEREQPGKSQSATSKKMYPIIDPARYSGQIRFINDTIAHLVVFTTTQKNTRNLYDTEVSVNAKITELVGGGLTVKAALQHVSEFCICNSFELKPKGETGYKITVDVPEGAEGLNVLWYVEPQGKIQLGGRMYVSKKTNFKIISLPDPVV